MVYGVLHDRAVTRKVVSDADRAMSTDDGFSELRRLENLHGAALETLRMWPVAPFTPRTAIRDFEFGGFRVEEGTDVLVAQTVTHYLDEYFPNPHRFELERHLEPRRESRKPGVFAPFSLGAHTCLGAGAAEVQIMVTMAALLHRFELELEYPERAVPVYATPIPNVGRRFSVRVRARR